MKLIFGSILLVLSVVNCNRQLDAGEASANTIPLGYYSDYFVFIADDDQDDPLVVPIEPIGCTYTFPIGCSPLAIPQRRTGTNPAAAGVAYTSRL